MSETRRLWFAILGLCLGAALLALALPEMTPGGPISTNARADGVRAAWRYLGERGWPVENWRQPLSDLPPDRTGVLVISVPAVRPYRSPDIDAVRRWLMVGGDVLLLLDGTRAPGPGGWPLLDALDIERVATSDEAEAPDLPDADDPLTETLRQEMNLTREDGVDAGPVRIRRARLRVRPDPDEVWVLRSADRSVGARIRRNQQGRVAIVDDLSLLQNGWFARPGAGNPAAVEALLAELDADEALLFDEWHLGLQQTLDAPAANTSQRALDLLLGHLLLIYAGIAWALGRRFGPGRALDPPPRTSVDRDLRALGALHTRAGHADALGQRLLDLAHRRARVPLDLPDTFDGGAPALLALARRVATLQADGHL